MNTQNLTAFLYSLGNALLLALLLAFSHGLLKWVATQKVDGYINLLINHWLYCTRAQPKLFCHFDASEKSILDRPDFSLRSK